MCSSPALLLVLSFLILQFVLKKLFQLVFTKTRILSVKIATLTTFMSMVKTLDQVRYSVLKS